MTCLSALSIGQWTHHSWLMRARPVRGERALADASARLLAEYPQLTRIDFTKTLPCVGDLPRAACARLFRVTAALACSRSVRRVVTRSAHLGFARNVAPHVLRDIQKHARGEQDDLAVGATPNFFDRRDMTAAGLALALRGLGDSGDVQHTWLRLRMPRDIVEAATRFNAIDIPVDAARALIDDARLLMRGEPC
ncbi:hypothetical protein [Paraburkholderia rhizosphaerae]|uniref:Uncharacterized protein n=1 Tax=Paraburkholderia rhizosphaerae TaxID=480658 RepID=A0A4R8LZW5_9BURK|nr:hypothetical protein [Paraburkholderia rhizosphaerae]TDY53572.1 hypothetical protein BX592_103385 [Paraburkholderia rhizosphaerae]